MPKRKITVDDLNAQRLIDAYAELKLVFSKYNLNYGDTLYLLKLLEFECMNEIFNHGGGVE